MTATASTQAHTLPAEFEGSRLPLIEEQAVPLCAVCGGAEGRPWAWGLDYELQTCRNVWRFVACTECGHVQLSPRPAVATLGTIYPATYYSYDFESKVHPVALRAKAMLDRAKLAGIFGHARTPQRFLDIGCGSGRFLRQAREMGLAPPDILGLELDARATARLRDEGFDVRNQRVEEADFVPASVDVVTMFHVIEHVAEPAEVLSRIASWMRSGAVLAIETPNLDSLDARLFRRTWWGGYHIPRHWHLFTATTLERLLRQAGLQTASLRHTTGHSFWLYSLHHALRYNRRFPMPRLARFFDPLRSLMALALVTAFDLVRARLGARTSSMLIVARKP